MKITNVLILYFLTINIMTKKNNFAIWEWEKRLPFGQKINIYL